jgi:hypothetical protein
MKTKTKLLNLIIALSLFSNCLKEDCDNSTENKYVDKNYLPYIIPYTDTSTRLFLKNGKDTLLFKSQGLKETIEMQKGNDIGNCKTYKLQQYSFKMAASDTDFFEFKYVSLVNSSPRAQFEFYIGDNYNKTYQSYNLYSYLKAKKITILNTSYDSSYSLPDPNFEEIYINLNVGLLKVKTSKYSLELIK